MNMRIKFKRPSIKKILKGIFTEDKKVNKLVKDLLK